MVTSGPQLQTTTHFQDMYEEPIVAQQESCEDFVRVLRVQVHDDFLEQLLHRRIVTKTVFPHVNDAVEISHLVYTYHFLISRKQNRESS